VTVMSKATRQAFGESLARLGESHPEIVVLDADLAKSTKSEIFAKKFPNRFYEMGIQEANMIGTAAGLAFTGKMPFLCSFGCFLTGRYDIIRLSVAYAQANVRMVGTHAGVGIGDDGHSQMGLEDISLMRALPTMGVFQPMDAKETELVMDYLVKEWKGPAYLRLTRQNLPDLYPSGAKFQPGKLMEIRPAPAGNGLKAVCVASGAGVAGSRTKVSSSRSGTRTRSSPSTRRPRSSSRRARSFSSRSRTTRSSAASGPAWPRRSPRPAPMRRCSRSACRMSSARAARDRSFTTSTESPERPWPTPSSSGGTRTSSKGRPEGVQC
jgi:transketolase